MAIRVTARIATRAPLVRAVARAAPALPGVAKATFGTSDVPKVARRLRLAVLVHRPLADDP
ncbi:hypothetical protein AB0E54_41755, partial [Amycolatopsis coloradensis]